MVYKEYLSGNKDFDSLYEELTAGNIFDFYAGEWVLSKPTHPEGHIRPKLMRKVKGRFALVKRNVQEELLKEGSVAIIGELIHINRIIEADTEYDIVEDFLEEYGIGLEVDVARDGNIVDDGEIVTAMNKGLKAVLAQIQRREMPDSWTDVRFFISDILDEFVVSTAVRPDNHEFGTVSVTWEFDFGSLKDAIKFAERAFYEFEWDPNFGGDAWGNITENILKLWDEYPTAEFLFIDHVIDLAHNNNTWLDKFSNAKSLLDALDAKFDARTPKDFVDRLNDRKIKSAVQRVRL